MKAQRLKSLNCCCECTKSGPKPQWTCLKLAFCYWSYASVLADYHEQARLSVCGSCSNSPTGLKKNMSFVYEQVPKLLQPPQEVSNTNQYWTTKLQDCSHWRFIHVLCHFVMDIIFDTECLNTEIQFNITGKNKMLTFVPVRLIKHDKARLRSYTSTPTTDKICNKNLEIAHINKQGWINKAEAWPFNTVGAEVEWYSSWNLITLIKWSAWEINRKENIKCNFLLERDF